MKHYIKGPISLPECWKKKTSAEADEVDLPYFNAVTDNYKTTQPKYHHFAEDLSMLQLMAVLVHYQNALEKPHRPKPVG